MRRTTLLVFSLVFAFCCGNAAAAEADSYYEKILAEKNIEATADGLNEYFHNLHPSDEQRERAARLIEQLGTTDSFAAREDAMAKLIVMPTLPTEALVKASEGKDPEVRWRAQHVLAVGKPESERVFYAALKTVTDKKLAGTTVELLRALPLCDKSHLKYAAGEALAAAARADDAPVLRRALNSRILDTRVAAIAALGAALRDKAADDLQPLLDDSDDRVKLAAARAVANYGGRDSLPALVKLLSSDDREVRVWSSVALRELSGKHFEFSAYDKPEKRAESIKKWQDWIDGDGKTAKLNFPLNPFGGSGVSYLGGNTLLAFGYNNKVAEYDPSEKEIWSYTGAQGVWSAEKLANGNVLLAAYSQRRVVEVTPSGDVVWEYPSNYPLNAKQLANGNVLIAEFSGGRVIEVDREKNIVWEHATGGSCCDAHRLDNGNTVYGVSGRGVFEVTPDKDIVWQFDDGGCYGCQPLPNGNVLIASLNGRVHEVTREKDVVWEFAENSAVDAFRLPNGNTLITAAGRFIEVTPDKEIVWTKSGCNYGTARR